MGIDDFETVDSESSRLILALDILVLHSDDIHVLVVLLAEKEGV